VQGGVPWLLDAEKSLKNLEWEHEVQMQRFAKAGFTRVHFLTQIKYYFLWDSLGGFSD